MRLTEIAAACAAEIVVAPPEGVAPQAAYTSDLLSDVVAHAPENALLITIQNHLNTVAACTLVGVRAVLICHRRELPEAMRAAAAREGIALLSTPLDQFAASCRVGRLLQAAVEGA